MTLLKDQQDRFETFYQGNSGHAVVLLPGLCGSELEMGAIPRLLRQSNHTYAIPKIPGYSAHTGLTDYTDWIETVDLFISDLELTHKSVSLVGLSMGATLALALAGRHNNILSLCLLSPVLFFDGWAIPWYHPLLSLAYRLGFRNWHYKESEPFGVKNKELRRHIKRAVHANSVSELGAAHLPAKHLYQSLQLVSATKKMIEDITTDVLIIHAIDDETASPKNPKFIVSAINSEICRVIWLGNSYHMITVDNEREIVANEVNKFIGRSIQKIELAQLDPSIPQLIIKNRNDRKKNNLKLVFCSTFLLMCLTSNISVGQTLPTFKSPDTNYQVITLSAYLSELNEKNASLRAKKLNADSAVSVAKQAGMPYLNPVLTYVRGSIYTQAPYAGYTNPASNTLGATVTLEGWGKRSAREIYSQAEANRQLAEMIVETHSIQTQAIFNYIDALRTKLLWQSYQSAIDKLDSFKGQNITEQKKEFLAAQKVLANDLKYYSYGLMSYLAVPDHQLPLPVGSMDIPPQKLNVTELINRAEFTRVELISNKASIESANANLEVVKASKNVDLMPGVYYSETPPYSSSGVGYGTQKSFSFLVSIPLGNGLLINSDLITASNTVAEQEVNLVATKTKIITEINQVYLQYQSAKDRLEIATTAYAKAKPSLNAGMPGLLKFRDAEYELIDARNVHAKTLILLQRLSGNFEVPNLN